MHPDAEDRGLPDPATVFSQCREFIVKQVIAFEDVLAGPVETLPGLRQLERSFFAVDQLNFVSDLQLGQLLGDCRLTDIVEFGRAGEIFQLHKVTKDFGDFQIHQYY